MASDGDREENMTEEGQSGGAEISKILSGLSASPSGQTIKIVRIGQAGGTNRNSTVTAVKGGQTTLAEGTTYIEVAQTGGTTTEGGHTAATMDHILDTSSVAAAGGCEPAGLGQGLKRKVDQVNFGDGKTVALLLSGSGQGSVTFKKDVELMKTLLTSEKIGLSEDLLISVHPKPNAKAQTTKTQTRKAIDTLKEELEDSADNNFIFYYSGHFFQSHKFKVDERSDQSQNYYKDEDLADLLLTIPAKNVLLILDMCYSGLANVRAKDGDVLPETEGVGEEEELADVPLLCDFMISGKGRQAKGDPAKGDPEMVVQWSSSLADQRSSYDKSSVFTQAIVDVVTAMQTHATVLQVHKHVINLLKERKHIQRPVIKPDYADTEYFKRFPGFVRVKSDEI